jgi:hypothetical protein
VSCDTFVDVPCSHDGFPAKRSAGTDAMSDEHHDLSGSTGPAWGARESGAMLKAFDATGRFLLVFEARDIDGAGILAAEIGLRDAGVFDILHDREGARLFSYEVSDLETFIKAGPLRGLRRYGDDVGPAAADALDLFQAFRDTFPQAEAIAERLREIHVKALAKARRDLMEGPAPGTLGAEETGMVERRLRDWADQIAPERLPPGLRRDHAVLTLTGRSLDERASALLRILDHLVPVHTPKERSGPRT